MKEKRKFKGLLAIASSALVICLAVGSTYAWLSSVRKLNAISLIMAPSQISILGSERSELTQISLALTENDTQSETQITINRVFCVESSGDFFIEVARTTNIDNMQIQIFPVSVANSEQTGGSVSGGWYSANSPSGVRYYKSDAAPIDGHYLNKTADGIADDTYHNENYSEGDSVQKNAEPLFWISNRVEDYQRTDYFRSSPASDSNMTITYRYYVMRISWDSASEETDLIYLMASH